MGKSKNYNGGKGGYDKLQKSLMIIKKRDEERAREVKDKIDAVAISVEKAALAGTLETKKFNIIETNIFAKIEESGEYIPAEISIAKFSLKEGVVQVYHAFPKAGVIPLGYKRVCMESSNKGHKIPLDDMSAVESNVINNNKVEFQQKSDGQIFKDILVHLAKTEEVFCMPEKLAQCEGVFRTISNRSSLEVPVIKFLPLPELLFRLGNSSKEGQMIPSVGVAEGELDSERFLYKSGLCCPWHEVMTETNNCTSATTRRLCYTVLDLCCQYYKIPLISGKHIPRTVETDPVVKEWTMPKVRTGLIRNTVPRRAGEFVSEDVRLRRIDDKIDKDERIVEGKLKVGNEALEIAANIDQNMKPPGTISEYIGAVTESVNNLSMLSECSSDADLITMSSISEVAPKSNEQVPVVVKVNGIGRGSVLTGRRFSRLAANFSAVGKCD